MFFPAYWQCEAYQGLELQYRNVRDVQIRSGALPARGREPPEKTRVQWHIASSGDLRPAQNRTLTYFADDATHLLGREGAQGLRPDIPMRADGQSEGGHGGFVRRLGN